MRIPAVAAVFLASAVASHGGTIPAGRAYDAMVCSVASMKLGMNELSAYWYGVAHDMLSGMFTDDTYQSPIGPVSRDFAFGRYVGQLSESAHDLIDARGEAVDERLREIGVSPMDATLQQTLEAQDFLEANKARRWLSRLDCERAE